MARARRPASLRVVAIGASAGGLEPMKELLAALPVDTGLGFVVLQHLAPSSIGKLVPLLASATTMPVTDIKNGERVEPNHVYVVPPATDAALFRGAVVLRRPRGGGRPKLPIDGLFRSLAAVLGPGAIGIVLSGTASDGSEGMRAIKAAGGVTYVQEPASAQFDDMPRNAIATGSVDFVLTVPDIAAEIARTSPATASTPPDAGAMTKVLELLRDRTGIDFTSYKRSTIERRLSRQVGKRGLRTLDEYAGYLDAHPDEATELYEDLLIHVTEFFRDAPALEGLVTRLVPQILAVTPPQHAIRVWVPGCSTGEEVYSIAMLLTEALAAQSASNGMQLQLFGTDLSERAIEVARAGVYPAAIAEQVTAERLAKFFVQDGDHYRIVKSVRESCVFVRHDLASDPPFSRLDVVSCRNVLIYLTPPLQQTVMPLFHYALGAGGYLLLGRSESITGYEDLFTLVERGQPIYARREARHRVGISFTSGGQLARSLTARRPGEAARTQLDILRDVDHVLLARYAPACVLVDEHLDILQFRGRTGAFLEPPPGVPQLNLLRMARDGLAAELRVATQSALRRNQAVRHERITMRADGVERLVNLEVIPLRAQGGAARHFLVVFEEAGASEPARRSGVKAKTVRRSATQRDELARITGELAATQEYLSSVLAQHLATSDELGIANEELQSTNEELHSSNEELQTAKEELQSTNEELETVNDELQRGNRELRDVNDDLVNILASVDIPIIIVDEERRIRRFTPRARAVLNVIASDVGRAFSDIQPAIAVEGLDGLIAGVIETLVIHESEVRDVPGNWYRMQIRPFRTVEDRIRGAVLSFVDVTALKASRDFATSIVQAVANPLVVIDDALAVHSANAAFLAAFPAADEVLAARPLRGYVKTCFSDGRGFDDVELSLGADPQARTWLVSARLVSPEKRTLVISFLDISDRHRIEAERHRLEQHERQAAEALQRERTSFLNAVSHELRAPLSSILLWTQVLREPQADEQWQRGLDTIERSAQAEAKLVDDLLDLAQARSPQALAVVPELVDPAPLVTAAIDVVGPDAEAKGVEVRRHLGAGLQLHVDPRRLQQIAWNLVANAVKFTPAGGHVDVSLAQHDHEIVLRVTDSGRGIRRELLPSLFEPFVVQDGSTTRMTDGLGIGLALVRHLVERHGGRIEVASDGEGAGSTFTVRIPSHGLPVS